VAIFQLAFRQMRQNFTHRCVIKHARDAMVSSLTPCSGAATTGEPQPIAADNMKAIAKMKPAIISVL
jgi:hypothetical protein